MVTQTRVLPLVYQGHVVEPDSNGRFVQDLGRTPLQILYDDSLSPNSSKVLTARETRNLWGPFQSGENIDSTQFYSEELHKPHGAESGDLTPMITQLGEEIHNNLLYVNGLFVVADKKGMVLNLGDERLPAFIQPVGVYTAKAVNPTDKEHGMTLKEFQGAGGRIVAYGRLSAGQYQLKHGERITVPQGIQPLGVEEGDEIYVNLDPGHSDGVKALGWVLPWPGGRSSVLYADIRLDDWDSVRGVLRGRRLNAATGYQEAMREAAEQSERTARFLRNKL